MTDHKDILHTNTKIIEKALALLFEGIGIFFLLVALYEIPVGGNPISPQSSTTIASVFIAFGSLVYAKVIPLYDILFRRDEK